MVVVVVAAAEHRVVTPFMAAAAVVAVLVAKVEFPHLEVTVVRVMSMLLLLVVGEVVVAPQLVLLTAPVVKSALQ